MPVWAMVILGFAGAAGIVAAIDTVIHQRQRKKWLHELHIEDLRRYGVAKLKEIPAPAVIDQPKG